MWLDYNSSTKISKWKNSRPHVIESIEELNEKIWNKIVNCLTWMRPSWRLHLWHYKWALENWLIMQDHPNIKPNFLIADYQVLWDHLWKTEQLRQSVVDMVIDWLSIWLDPERSNFIVQSYVPEFSELFNYLTMFTPYWLVINNPTLKEEMKKIEDKNNQISLGFINYPISQIADIMLPKWEIIPVWEDQIPHIELARNIIKRVNNMYGIKYPLPLAMISNTPRLVWIDWKEKMSKSLWNTIFITSTNKEIMQQVNKMYTDSWKTSMQAPWNIKNHVVFKYLDIFYNDKNYLEDLKRRYTKWWENSVWDWELKKLLTNILEEFIAPIREKREYYLNNMDIVTNAIEKWSNKVRKEAKELLTNLKEAMGLLNYWK